jgi:hypothetical protein
MKIETYYTALALVLMFIIIFGVILRELTGIIFFSMISGFLVGYFLSDWSIAKIKLAYIDRKND